MTNLNYWNNSYPLNYEECPCDVDFVDWLKEKNIIDKQVFHFGTGSHHYVGINTPNSVLGITASVQEYEAYMKLVIDNPIQTKRYKAFFGDIYQLDQTLLPKFDIISLFHLCEFRDNKNSAYGALTDFELLSMLTAKLNPNGFILFYTGSNGFNLQKQPSAPTVIEQWLNSNANIQAQPAFKSLQVYQVIS